MNEVEYTVTGIGAWSFKECSTLTSVMLPTGVKSIGEGAFYDCEGLKNITIPDNLMDIGKNAFYSCSKLTDIIIPDGVERIGRRAFSDCSSLKSVAISDNSRLSSIETGTFSGCKELKSITIPKGVTQIGDMAFEDSGLITIRILSEVTSIGSFAFSGCSSLVDLTIPSSVNYIGSYAFSDCSSLVNITIPSSMTSIGEGVFSDCSGLVSITIPATITSIGDWAFDGCVNLTTVIYKGTEEQWNNLISGPNNNALKNITPTFSNSPYTPPANPTIDITGKEGGTVIYDRNRHTVTITPNDNYLVKEISLNGTPVSVTDGTMVLENIYSWSRISVTFEKIQEPAFDIDKYISDLKMTARSSKTSKGNIRIKVTSVTDSDGNILDLTELKDKGYTVKFKYYRSTKKSLKYNAMIEKDADINSYINTSGKKGTKYYYKVRVMIYDADGSLVAKSDLKQCRYAARTWSK